MKLRSGFVSNSSSSSFIASDKTMSTSEIAELMTQIVIFDYLEEEGDSDWVKEIKAIQLKIIELCEQEYDGNILLPFTCNYQTLIYRDGKGGDILIKTCNNHPFYDLKTLTYVGEYSERFERTPNEFLDVRTGLICEPRDY